MNEERNHERKPGVLDVFKSVGAAFLGVQSEANRQRDFSRGKLHHYIIAGAVATVAFILLLYGLVQLVLATAQGS